MGSSPFARTKKAVEHSTAFFVRASGLAVSFPSVTNVTSPQGEYTSPTFGRSHYHRTTVGSLDHFLCELRASPNEGGGLLPPGRAARILLYISDFGIFRVVKTTTLISVKQLIHSYLQVTPQLRRHWRTFHGQMCRTAKSTSKRNRGDAYLPYCRRYRKSGTEINRPTIYGSCHSGYVHPDFYEPFSILEAIRYHITFIVNLFQSCFRSAIDLEFKHID